MRDPSHERRPRTAAAAVVQIIMGTEGQLIGAETRHYRQVTSTMDVARQLVREGAGEGTVILADEQTQGRGRLGRQWLSHPGQSMSLSVILHPTLRQLPQLNMVASLATVRAITQVARLRPLIKWPNDILVAGRKVAGILIESRADFAVVGIGNNVNQREFSPELREDSAG